MGGAEADAVNFWEFLDKHPVLSVVLLVVAGGLLLDLANALRRRP